MRRRGRRGREKKRGKGIIMALFLIINILMISCGNGGPELKEGQAVTADGTIIDLKEIGSSIRGIVDFVMDVEGVESFISSIDEIA